MFNKRITKTHVLALALCFMLAGVVVYASADQATGTIGVTDEVPVFKDISFPLTATPGQLNTLTFTLQYQQGLYEMDEVTVDLFSNMASPDLPIGQSIPTTIDEFDHYRVRWVNRETPSPFAQMNPAGIFSEMTCTPDEPITTGSNIDFSIGITIPQLADASNPWTIRFHLSYGPDVDVTLDDYVIQTYEFDLGQYMGLNIVQSSFTLTGGQGGLLIPISVPTQGFLDLVCSANDEYQLQVYGTDPTFGAESFSVINILQNSVNDTGSASPLSLTAANIANLGIQPITTIGEEDSFVLFLWVSIPVSAVVGTYTFTLTVILTIP